MKRGTGDVFGGIEFVESFAGGDQVPPCHPRRARRAGGRYRLGRPIETPVRSPIPSRKTHGTPAVSVASAAGTSHQQQRGDEEQYEERDPANELEHQQSHARSTSGPSTELVRWRRVSVDPRAEDTELVALRVGKDDP